MIVSDRGWNKIVKILTLQISYNMLDHKNVLCKKVLFYSAMPGAAAIRGRLMSIDLRLVMLGGGMVVYERARWRRGRQA